MNKKELKQENIRLGTHGEDYGSWMSNPVFYIIGGITALAVVLAVLSFSVFHITVLGVLFSVVAAALMALLVWITWIRRQYAFGGGGGSGASMPLAAAGSWNRFTGSFSLIWTMTARAVSWKSAAAPEPCRFVRP